MRAEILPTPDERQLAANAVDASHGDGRAARTAQGLMNPRQQRFGLQLGMLIKLPDGFAGCQPGFQPMSQAIGDQNHQILAVAR